MKIVNVAEMVTMEKATDAAGFSYDQMMAAAGGALADAILELISSSGPVLFLIGPGNNGGDGLAACAQLQQAGINAIPYIWKRKRKEDVLVQAVSGTIWAEADYSQLYELISNADVIVDALLGTGNTRALGGSLADLLAVVQDALKRQMRSQPLRLDPTRPLARPRPVVVACDCPSGLFCDSGEIDPLALPADLTVTFALPKIGHFLQPGATFCGRLIIADINIDRTLAPEHAPELLTAEMVSELLPKRPSDAHKGTFGKALIIAGSANYPGAAAIASTAAYRAGAGLVHLATSAAVAQKVASQVSEPVYTLLPADLGAITADAVPILTPLFDSHQAVLLGPGLGTDKRTQEFIETLFMGKTKRNRPIGFLDQSVVESTQKSELPPLVIDADGLNALANMGKAADHVPALSILTPHPGEMARLSGLSTLEVNADRWGVARRFAQSSNQIVVLKGAFTAIAHADGRLAISPFAEASLATAGSGDVLAGVIVALLAQGIHAWDAARVAVYLHALAGRLAAEQCGPALLASDISRQLPQALAAVSGRVSIPPSAQ
ncbi:MAG: NAD(P)H-hydrate dehydratase [Chloroflexi bacterium]|nr:NAD(P)H-hydrate dehydratase [Chloroflexota bacterium]